MIALSLGVQIEPAGRGRRHREASTACFRPAWSGETKTTLASVRVCVAAVFFSSLWCAGQHGAKDTQQWRSPCGTVGRLLLSYK